MTFVLLIILYQTYKKSNTLRNANKNIQKLTINSHYVLINIQTRYDLWFSFVLIRTNIADD